MHLQPVPAPMVEANWDRVAGFVSAVSRKGPLRPNVDDLKSSCIDQSCQLWIIEDEAGEAQGVFITSVSDGVCEWNAVGGVDLAKWKHLEKTIEQWAKQIGCHAMRSFARKGWLRRSPDYAVKGVILEKEL